MRMGVEGKLFHIKRNNIPRLRQEHDKVKKFNSIKFTNCVTEKRF